MINHFFIELLHISNEMSPYLLFGFLLAGILHVLLPKAMISKYLGKRNIMSVIYATLLGIPLPLCSCGVIPTGISFHKEGASPGATVSFLISTPQTGVDSIIVTYSLLGLPFAIIRPIIAFISGILGGLLTNRATSYFQHKTKQTTYSLSINSSCENNCECKTKHKNTNNSLVKIVTYAYIEFMKDIGIWLLIGLLLATITSIAIPNDFFTTYITHSIVSMLIVLVISIPLYTCATGTIPLAAILLIKGVSPGTILVLLMAGPATSIASITILLSALGKRITAMYLLTIITTSVFFGLFVDYILPQKWFESPPISSSIHHHHEFELFPLICTIILFALLINSVFKKYSLVWYTKK